jgi:ATP-dependent Clp protease protease subunit
MSEVLRVPYNLPGSQMWSWVNIYTRMSQERILFLNQPLSDGVANSLISALLYLDSQDQNKPIYLYINSVGDPVDVGMANITAGMMSVMAGMAIYDTLEHIKSEVVTICLGQARGMAALLLSAGTKGKRSCLPNATIELTLPRSAMQGQATDIQVNANATLAKKKTILEILSQTTGKSLEELTKDLNRTLYLTPSAALEYGLIDRILTN